MYKKDHTPISYNSTLLQLNKKNSDVAQDAILFIIYKSFIFSLSYI